MKDPFKVEFKIIQAFSSVNIQKVFLDSYSYAINKKQV